MRLPLSAFEAFAEDSRNPSPSGVEKEERVQTWLTIASAAEALGSLRGRQLNEFLREFDDSLLPPAGTRPSIVHDVAAAPHAGLSQVTERFRVAAEEMERGGFLNLAYTTVSSLCRAMVREDQATRLMTTVHLGRIARQLSDIPVAIDCYRSVATTGLRKRDGPAAARGFIGLAMVAVMRGNLPLVRKMFERALLHSHPGSNTRGLAHMGLSNVCRRMGDFADALLHGWRAHDLVVDPNERVGNLGNLSSTALRAGFPQAALKGFMHVATLSAPPERVVGVYQDAMEAAAVLRDESQLRNFEAIGRAAAETLAQPFEIARWSLSSATAWRLVGDEATAQTRFEQAFLLAKQHGYHELQMRAEAAMLTNVKPERPRNLESADRWQDNVDESLIESIERFGVLSA